MQVAIVTVLPVKLSVNTAWSTMNCIEVACAATTARLIQTLSWNARAKR